tara:strand:+ start:4564 stop:5931 length:1368 start_codon:yes stop_codon:yes gene_type:complete
MGADQSLIKAAAQMGPKPWDYSGIMQGIAALGKYAATKQAVADELTSYSNEAFDTKEMPDAITNGPFGEQNMEFLIQAKNHYNNAVTIYKNPLNFPFTKKYKQAVKDINTIQSVLEKNKADLLVLDEVKKNVNEKWQNRSNGISRESFHRIADLQINNTTGDLDNATIFTPDGIKIYADDVVSMQPTEFSPNELMNGFFTNHMNNDNNNSNLRKIIKNNGEKRKNTDKQWREGDARDQIRDFMEKLKAKKEYGNKGITSLAFDFISNGESFVQANPNLFIDPNLSGDDATTTYVQQYMSINPEAKEEEIKLALNHQAVDVWNNSGADYETRIEDWLVGVAKADYDKAQTKEQISSVKGNIKLDWTGSDNTAVYLRPTDIPNIAEGVRERTTFVVGGTRFKYLNNQWVWDASGKGDEPVTGSKGQNYDHKDGSDEALLYRLNNNPIISEALKGDKN